MIEHILIKSSTPPVIEIDQTCAAVYVRFKQNAKVCKTVAQTKPGGITCAIDFDEKNEVIGVELVGVKEFSVSKIKKLLPTGTNKINFQKARFTEASYNVGQLSRDLVPQ